MGGSSESKTELPEWYQRYAEKSLGTADKIAQIGYRPELGPTLAGFNPTQMAAMQAPNDWAAAFGMGAMPPPQMPSMPAQGQAQSPAQAPASTPINVQTGMPQTQTYAGGIQALSSYPMYEQAMEQFRALFPGQSNYMNSFQMDPVTGVLNQQGTPVTRAPLGTPPVPTGVPTPDPGAMPVEDNTTTGGKRRRRQDEPVVTQQFRGGGGR